MIGIYKITSPSGKVYIGQSVNLERRLKRYKRLSVKTKKQTKLWRSLIKYSPEKHFYEVIEECPEKTLNIRERYWQEFYDSVNNGLNCFYTKTNDKSGKASPETLLKMSEAQKEYFRNNKHPFEGRKHSEETKQKIRDKATGRNFPEHINKKKGVKGRTSPMKGKFGKYHSKSKPVLCYLKSGEFVKEFETISGAAKELNLHSGNISSCCSGRLKQYKGYIFKYK